MTIDGHRIDRLLVERRIAIAGELYAAVLTDSASRGPVLLFSATGGMAVEEIAAADPGAVRRIEIDIAGGLTPGQAATALEGIDLPGQTEAISRFLADLYAAYRALDADLLEINPLALTDDGRLLCLDCKYTLDDSSAGRQAPVAEMGAPERMTELETEAHEAGLKYIELDGSVGVLANGAGLTMATMDAIAHYGGAAGQFPGDRRRGLYESRNRAHHSDPESQHPVAADQFLRRLRAHRRDGGGSRPGVAEARSRYSRLLLHSRYR